MLGNFGGTLEFERLANGTMITRGWEFRFPVLGRGYERGFDEGYVRSVARERTREVEVLGVARKARDDPR